MTTSCVALFGEAEKGALDTVYFCPSLPVLFERLGEPPDDTKGLFFAIQALLYNRAVIYFRVREEGVSLNDYQFGMRLLRNLKSPIICLAALFLPGVGEEGLISEGISLCHEQHSLLIVRESDFYDYMTDK